MNFLAFKKKKTRILQKKNTGKEQTFLGGVMKKIIISSGLFLTLLSASTIDAAPKDPVKILAKTWCGYLTGCCATFAMTDCMTAFLNETSMVDQFGLPYTGKPFKSIAKALKSGAVTVDVAALLSCIEETQNMECSYLETTNTWDCSDPTDLHNLEDLVGAGSPENLAATGATEFTPSCSDVFSK